MFTDVLVNSSLGRIIGVDWRSARSRKRKGFPHAAERGAYFREYHGGSHLSWVCFPLDLLLIDVIWSRCTDVMTLHRFDSQLRSLAKLPEYFDTFGLHEPIGKYNTPIAFSQGDASITVWEHVNRSPEKMNTFMKSMVAMSSKTVTIGTYDFSWVNSKASESPDRPLIVDVGGGKGHALQKIADATPGLPMERCVVEDLAPVLDEAKAQASGSLKQAQFVALDFHSEQPVKGAVVYYIRRCLHDYGDDDCVDILQQISNAMVADSRILIVENVMGDPPSPISIGNDILMMMLGGKERTLEGFKKIMGRAGLVVEKLWRVERTDYAIIEGRKA